MRLWLALVVAALVLLAPRGARAQLEAEDPPETAGAADEGGAADDDAAGGDDAAADDHAAGGDAEGDAAEGDDGATQAESDETDRADEVYEPDQRGYEPDQRGYEPDQRGYEPDQRGYELLERRHEGADAEEAEPVSTQAEYGASGSDEPIGFDLSLWLGGGLSSIEAIENDNLVRGDQQGGFGASFGITGGLRIGPAVIGPRVGLTVDPSFTLAALGLDVRAALMDGELVPTVRASVSYALLLGLREPLPSQPNAEGVLAELGVGLEWRFAAPFVIGAELSAGYLHLERGAVEACEAPCTDGAFDLARPGTSDGLTLRLHVSGGVRF